MNLILIIAFVFITFLAPSCVHHHLSKGEILNQKIIGEWIEVRRTNTVNSTRTTLYWNPLLLTDSTGEAGFSFYNSDITSRYHIIIEGIAADGRIGRLDTAVAVKE